MRLALRLHNPDVSWSRAPLAVIGGMSVRPRGAGKPRAIGQHPPHREGQLPVRGPTVAAESPAFEHIVAGADAFLIAQVRAARAILLGSLRMDAFAAD